MLNETAKTTESLSSSRHLIWKILEQAIDGGSYSVPHVIHKLPLSSAHQAVVLALFKLQDEQAGLVQISYFQKSQKRDKFFTLRTVKKFQKKMCWKNGKKQFS